MSSNHSEYSENFLSTMDDACLSHFKTDKWSKLYPNQVVDVLEFGTMYMMGGEL